MADPIVISLMEDMGVASVIARNGRFGEAVIQRPDGDGPVCFRDGRHTFLGVGPGQWLALQETGAAGFVAALSDRLGDAAWIVDQSGAYLVFKVAGVDARTLLQRGIPIDLHPDVFGPGVAASSSIAHMTILLWRLEAADAFAVAVSRSYGTSFHRWLDQAVAAL